MTDKIVLLILCHLIGDYVLQPRFIANTKGQNWYHMFIHCALYCAPFWFFFGCTWELALVFTVHVLIDTMKARWGLIGYRSDQTAHYGILSLYIPRLYTGDMFSDNDLWIMIGGLLTGVLIIVVLDIVYDRKTHRLEMEEYYERLGQSPHNWGY